jgi:hypothetical protein
VLKAINAKHRSTFAALSPVMVRATVQLKNCSCGYKHTNAMTIICHTNAVWRVMLQTDSDLRLLRVPDEENGFTAVVTGLQRMLTPVWHVIPSRLYTRVNVWLNFLIDFLLILLGANKTYDNILILNQTCWHTWNFFKKLEKMQVNCS